MILASYYIPPLDEYAHNFMYVLIFVLPFFQCKMNIVNVIFLALLKGIPHVKLKYDRLLIEAEARMRLILSGNLE